MRILVSRCPAAVLAVVALVLSACSSGSAGRKAPVHQMGEKVEYAPFILSVIDTKWETHLGEGPSQRVPLNRYLLVRLTAMNTGSAENTVPLFSLTDSAGNQYAEVSDVGNVPRWLGLFRNVKPAATIEGDIVFDVSPGTYRLQVQDSLDDTRTAMIELPLKFDVQEGLLPQARPDKPLYDEMLKKQ